MRDDKKNIEEPPHEIGKLLLEDKVGIPRMRRVS